MLPTGQNERAGTGEAAETLPLSALQPCQCVQSTALKNTVEVDPKIWISRSEEGRQSDL